MLRRETEDEEWEDVKPKKIPAKKGGRPQKGWGFKEFNPEDVISLDDSDFGKFGSSLFCVGNY